MKKHLICLFILINIAIFSKGESIWRFEHAFLFGSADEIVYKSGGEKLSELTWGLEDVRLIGIGHTYKFNEYFKINGDLFINYNQPMTEMDDYDWLQDRPEWTHWSNSPTEIERVIKFDMNLEFKLFTNNNFEIFLLGGYKYDMFSWVARGGEYIYSKDGGFRNNEGILPSNQDGISYNQYFYLPYLGLGANYSYNNFIINGKFLYSSMVEAQDEDTHHFRDLYFEGFFNNGEMLQIDLGMKYQFNSNFSLLASYEYTKYFLNKGYTVITDLGSGQQGFTGDGSVGLANYHNMLSFGIEYMF